MSAQTNFSTGLIPANLALPDGFFERGSHGPGRLEVLRDAPEQPGQVVDEFPPGLRVRDRGAGPDDRSPLGDRPGQLLGEAVSAPAERPADVDAVVGLD